MRLNQPDELHVLQIGFYILFLPQIDRQYMNIHRLNHTQLLKGVSMSFQRYLSNRVKWENRLVGIFGARGVGKTTLLLQHIKSVFGDTENALYLPLDNIWFQSGGLTETAKAFYDAGGLFLFLDNVHRYEDWMPTIGKLLESCPNLHIVFATSSLVSTAKLERAFKDEAAFYTLPTLSFREYLDYEGALEMEACTLDELLLNHGEIVQKVMDEINVVPIFRNYLEHGCYPFYWEDPDAYFFRLEDMMSEAVDIDLPAVVSSDYSMQQKMKQLLLLLATSAPEIPKMQDMIKSLKLDNPQIHKCMDYIEAMGILRLLQSSDETAQTRLKKMYLGNTNLLASLFREEGRAYTGETFFVDQMSNCGSVEILANNDFLVNGKYTFAVGDPLMDYKRIETTENAFAAVHGLPKSSGRKMPVWALGLCY